MLTEYEALFYEPQSLGLKFKTGADGRVVVEAVRPHSEAEDNGVQVGDALLAAVSHTGVQRLNDEC